MDRRGSLLLAGATLCLAIVLMAAVVSGGVAAEGGVSSIGERAVAVSQAIRGEQVQLAPAPTMPPCSRVAAVGDSLTAASRSSLVSELDRAGLDNIVDGQVSRRIPAAVRDPYSGVSATRRIRATWGEADCWVIGLGSNDLESGADDPIRAARWIDEQMAAVTPGARVWWLNVYYRYEAGNAFDFPSATAVFNGVLAQRAAADPLLEVLDWFSLVEMNPGWLVDGVHVRAEGYLARTRLTMDALPR